MQSITTHLDSCDFFSLSPPFLRCYPSQVCMALNLTHLFIQIMHFVRCIGWLFAFLLFQMRCQRIFDFFSPRLFCLLLLLLIKRPYHGIDFLFSSAYLCVHGNNGAFFATKNPVETQRISTSIVCHVNCIMRFIFEASSSIPPQHITPEPIISK